MDEYLEWLDDAVSRSDKYVKMKENPIVDRYGKCVRVLLEEA